ncbi:hypothetical protein GXM_07058 [Nostoc sphaeroides CCNUC1]|uniref:Uncharacterized protein n=1 Tax=Nostoc sphaeroides CCNUC1 TaxID=2653204 RepID=A0A5P8WAD9_9NOSO|nr:hypothetical protein GXM_07058 [Nostoc sphaeroides CCNUC1]
MALYKEWISQDTGSYQRIRGILPETCMGADCFSGTRASLIW